MLRRRYSISRYMTLVRSDSGIPSSGRKTRSSATGVIVRTVRSWRVEVFDRIGSEDYEQVVYCHDRRTGLRAVIAIHSTRLGPALGGTRMWAYATEDDALADALRLGKAMAYKAACADLPLGGGKAVIIGDARRDKTDALLRAYGRQVERLGGTYITTADVGTTVGNPDDKITMVTAEGSYHLFCCRPSRKFEPFVGLGLGYVSGHINTHGIPYYGAGPDNRGGLSLGGGLAVWPIRHVGARLEVKHISTYCNYGPICNVLPGDGVAEFRTAITFR